MPRVAGLLIMFSLLSVANFATVQTLIELSGDSG